MATSWMAASGTAADGDVAATRGDQAGGCRDRVGAGGTGGRRWPRTARASRTRIETLAAPAFAIIIGTRNGETRSAPLRSHTRTCSTRVSKPPTPVAKITPGAVRVGVELAGVGPGQLGGGHAHLGEAVDAGGPPSGPNQADGSKSGTAPLAA